MIFEKQILKIYNSTLLKRHDPDGSIFYFGKEDFPGLMAEDFSFLGEKGQRLSGHFYYRDARRTDRLVIFEHGMGCGHVAYMQEINLLTTKGYTVFTYDHTGTRCSEGEHIGGFAQSLSDLDHCIKAIRTLPEYENTPLSVVGHSWGGFSTMNITAIYPEITHAVALSGFISPKAIQEQSLAGILRFYRKAVWREELDAFPHYALFDARESLKTCKTKVLIIHSRDDAIVSFDKHFSALEAAVSDNENVTFLALDGKGHNPNYTAEAVSYKDSFFTELKVRTKEGVLNTDAEKQEFVGSFDWARMTEQDMDVWEKIFAFLES